MHKEEVQNWYNAYIGRQKRIGLNLRHYYIFRRCVRAGMRRKSKVLEVGCGIGTLTTLLSSYLKHGTLVATDISDESIELAKQLVPHSERVQWLVTDMRDFESSVQFDFIILPDVLEHIPVDQHLGLFQTLSKHLADEGHLLINIPHPRFSEFMRRTAPEKLQIIDQALDASVLLRDAYAAGLMLESYESHQLFYAGGDYAFVHFSKVMRPAYRPLAQFKIIWRKTLARVFYYQALLFR